MWLILPMPLCHPVVYSAKQDRTTCRARSQRHCGVMSLLLSQGCSRQRANRRQLGSSLTKHHCSDVTLSGAFAACCVHLLAYEKECNSWALPISVRLRRVTGSLPRTESLKLSMSSAGNQAVRELLAQWSLD